MKLYMFYLGGSMPGFSIEAHDIAFVVAQDIDAAASVAKERWCGKPTSVHVDAVREVRCVAGYRIELTPHPVISDLSLYAVNLGYYLRGTFNELHQLSLVAAPSKSAALKQSLKDLPQGAELGHGDNIYDIDDCIRVDKIDDYWINLSPSEDDREDDVLHGPRMRKLCRESLQP